MPEALDHSTSPALSFPGFPDFRANVTYCPVQFFTVVLPFSSRGCVRVVSYMIRRVLGWVDAEGNPTEERLAFSLSELSQAAGISRRAVPDVLQEAIERRFIRCVRQPRADTLGRAARSGAYELLWDHDGRYTDSPDNFSGFYYPEAWTEVSVEGENDVRRAKASRKNIPNAFFDVVIPNEPLSVVRSVGALLFYSIQWGTGGERKAPVAKSITELSNLTKLSRHHTHQAITTALQTGYVERISDGIIDFNAGISSRCATYAIRWQRGPVRMSEQASVQPPIRALPVQKGERENQGDRCKKVNGEPVQKGERDRCKKVNGDRCKKVNGIILKQDPKTSNTKTAAAPSDDPTPPAAAAASILLEGIGFDSRTAHELSTAFDHERIARQVGWLSLRNASSNPLGLLRRAIEEDWPEPKGRQQAHEPIAGRAFAEYFYGAYQGTPGEGATNIFRGDAAEAARFLEAAGVSETEVERAQELGRSFGIFVRAGQGVDSKTRPHLSSALVQFGNAFRKNLRSKGAVRDMEARQRARKAHHDAFQAGYMGYLGAAEKSCQTGNTALYEAFHQDWQRRLADMASGPLRLSGATLERLGSEAARLHAFFDFCRKSGQLRLLDFWEWDGQQNPTPFKEASAG